MPWLKQSQLLGDTVKITSFHLFVTAEVKKKKIKYKYHNFPCLSDFLNSLKCSKITQILLGQVLEDGTEHVMSALSTAPVSW